MPINLRTQFAYGTLILLSVAAPLWWIGLERSKESNIGDGMVMIGGFIAFVALVTFSAYIAYCVYDFIDYCFVRIKRKYSGD